MQAKRVTAIPATLNRYTSESITRKKKRRVAGYARVSTDHEDQQNSYAAQVDYYTNYIKGRDDWEFVAVFADEGTTGCNTRSRNGFNTMIEQALAGSIDLIITKSVSRFARNTVDSLTTIRKLKEVGCECYFEKEGIWTFDSKGELLITIMSSLAQEESRSISENCTWGQRKRFADGKVTVPFSRFLGYDRGEDGNLVINKEEAIIVKRIYGLFLQGRSPYTIARLLNEECVRTASGKGKWCGSTVESILTNEKYKGDALLQKSYTTDFLTKKSKKNHGEVQQFYVQNNHDAIIDPATFDRVQALIAIRHSDTGRSSGEYAFSGMLKCPDCGSWYGPKVWHSNSQYRKTVWRCNHKYKSNGGECNSATVSEEDVKEAFVKAVNILCGEKDAILEDYKEIMESLYDTTDLETEKANAANEINDTAILIENCVKENARVAQNQNDYYRKYAALVDRLKSAEDKFKAADEEITWKNASKAKIEQFLKALKDIDLIDGFDENMWYNLVDYATVYGKSDIRFTFKNGTEI